MKNFIKNASLLITLSLLILMSCSKSEDVKPSPTAILGGTIYRSQIVTVTLPDIALTDDEYQATLGGFAVKLSKLDGNKLLLPVNFAVPLGLKDLVIPSLKNVTIRYDIKDPVLPASPEATIEPFINKLETYSKGLDSSPNSLSIQKSIESFNAVYAKLTPAEKTEIAMMYTTNKDIIDPILFGDFSKFNSKRTSNEDIRKLVILHKAAVLGIAAGAVLFELGSVPNIKIFGAVLAGVSSGFAYDYYKKIIINRCVAVFIEFDKIVGTNNRVSNTSATAITLQSDIEKTVDLSLNYRTINSTDSSKKQSDFNSFFSFSERYNKIATNINTQINWVNANIIFANFSLLPLQVIPASSLIDAIAVNQNIFNNIKFSVSHPNLSLVSSSLASDGKLNMKIKIVGTPISLPIVSFLNYNYTDDFSSFSGTLPITVKFDCTTTTLAVTTSTTANSATAIPNGGQAPYTYLWSNGSTNATATNLIAGIYTVTVTDQQGCTKVGTATLLTLSTCDETSTSYPTVTIGSQVWMQKNLNVCKYRNGDDIPEVQDRTAWGALKTGAWCYYDNNNKVYGKLYNWYAVQDPRGLAPAGYHIPTDAEWTTLTSFLGGESVAGNKMKATTGWVSSSGITNIDSSGFTGLSGGGRDLGSFTDRGYKGHWWSVSVFTNFLAFGRVLLYNSDSARGTTILKNSGGYVRCIRD